ncbi:DoxX family protein [Amorphus orientalis]|uniref:Oxidoreductase n=1 Tax=Amorphus orientalis TaxID=649198 RepID=A0AAE3VM17_9HYPH|nr:DoxX family protein [Amorphus orientalis]MDQ0314166.1 putative oxidoreductase [Amorphus orientalis]
MGSLTRAYEAVFHGLDRILGGWFLGLAARFVFAAVLFLYFINSAFTKVGDGLFGFFHVSVGAYAQILPKMMEAVSYNTAEIAFFPYKLIVYVGTYMEFILPILIVLGLFTRLAALGMIGFIVIMTYTDIYGHDVGADTIGSLFNDNPSSLIADQRTLWVFVMLVLVLKGPGFISLDYLFGRWSRR